MPRLLQRGLAALAGTVAFAVSPETPLRQAPFLMTHDAGSGYCGKEDIDRLFVQTQPVDLFWQLSCGARALELRVVVDPDGAIRFYHGPWVSKDQTLDTEAPVLAEWAGKHPSELVLAVVSHCFTRAGVLDLDWKGIQCSDDRIVSGFKKAGIRVETDCQKVNNWTVAEATAAAQMDNGGKMIVVLGEGYCMSANFEPNVNKRDLVEPYVERTMASEKGANNIWSVQAFVQQTDKSVMVPIKDSVTLNPQIVQWIKGGSLLKGVNIVEINMVCQSGQAIARALGATVSPGDVEDCARSCKEACDKYGCSPAGANEVSVLV